MAQNSHPAHHTAARRVVTDALSYLVARATWHLLARHAQELAHRLTSSAGKTAPRTAAVAAAAVV
nr:hypothetical protein [Bradyrhizobium diazoefficiens]